MIRPPLNHYVTNITLFEIQHFSVYMSNHLFMHILTQNNQFIFISTVPTLVKTSLVNSE